MGYTNQQGESCLSYRERQSRGFFKSRNLAEQKFIALCEDTGRSVERVGFSGGGGWDDPIKMKAPDFSTSRAYVECKSIQTADHLKVKLHQFCILECFWHWGKSKYVEGESKPLLWFLYHKPTDKVAVISHDKLKDAISILRLPLVSLFPGNVEDEHQKGWKVPLDQFEWFTWQEAQSRWGATEQQGREAA